ncbi:unnamed protein product [Trifolium pratense]|uniref:Uncharacterized protein n=1 Tax=Trifolium pratense TaxID=57577 RepID=A0ACB0K1A9_TRIPR|nr:unnamed protein product [Trifolium pratense]
MGFMGKHNNAGGKDPDFGAIFMSNSGSKRECFHRGLFGLPSSYISFVEKIKAGSALFLFEYEKRLLHGVFKATCDGGINIVPKAFNSLGVPYPAQVKFVTIWDCKPLPERIFRDAIRENYFTSSKFHFGLSEDQVYKLLHLFSMNKLEPKIPRRHISRTDDMKSERYPVGKVGRSAGHGILDESVQNDQVLGDNDSSILMRNYQGDSTLYNGFSAEDILVNKQRRSSELGMDYTSGYVGDYVHSNDENRFAARNNVDYMDNYAANPTLDTANGYVGDYLAAKDDSRFMTHENEDYMGTHRRPYTVGGYSKMPSDKFRVHGDGRSPISDRLMGEDLRKTDKRMVFSDDIHGLHDSNVDLPVFYSKPFLEQNSLVENHLRSTSDMIHPFHLNTCATQGDESSMLYNSDAPGLNARQLSSFGNNGSESMTGRVSPSTNCRRNSVMHTELKDRYKWQNIGDCFSNSVLYGGNRDCMPFNETQNSDQLASESALYDACNYIPSLKSSPAPIPASDIGNSGRTHEPFSSMFHNHKSYLDNNVHPMALQNYPSHEITLPKKNEALSPDVPFANADHFQVQYDDPMDRGYDIGYYDDSQNSNHGHPKRKSTVFDRLSFAQNVNKRKSGDNAQNDEYDFVTSVDDVMEMVRQSHNHSMTKRKPKPSQRDIAESLRSKTQISSQKKKKDCFESALEHKKDESLRNKTQISSSSQRKKGDHFENALEHNKDDKLRNKTQISSPRKKRDFSETVLQHSEDESLRNKTQIISLKKKKTGDSSENALEDLNTDSTTVTGSSPKTKAKEVDFVDFKRRSKVRKHTDEIERSSDESKKSENLVIVQQKRRKLVRPNFNKSASFEDKDNDHGASQNLQLPLPNGSCNKDVIESCCTLVKQSGNDGVKVEAEVQNIIDPTYSEGKNSSHAIKFICSEGGEKENASTLAALNDGSECVDNKNHQDVLFSASCNEESSHTKEGSSMMDNVKAASLVTESMDAICQEKANVGTLPVLNYGSECVDNKNCQKILSSASCNEGSSHAKEGLCLMDNEKSASLETESFHAIYPEKANVGTPPPLNDGLECVDNKNHQSVLSSSHTKEGLCMMDTKEGSCVMDNVKSASLETESLHVICEEKANIGTLRPLNDGTECADSKNHQKVLSSASCKEGSSHTKKGSCVTDDIKSTTLENESLKAICLENCANKIMCADRGINADDEMPKDCGSFSVEAKDGSEYLGNSGNEKAPIETSCHIEACR